jgi:DNA-binding MarR family transcriptional regulator
MKNESVLQHETVEQLTLLVRELSNDMKQHSACEMLRIMRREDISMPQLVTLWRLRYVQTMSITKLSDHLNLSLAATSHLVDRLVQGGFVSRAEDAQDRRFKQVTITDAGVALIDAIERDRDVEWARRLAHLPPALLASAVEALTGVLAHLRQSEMQTEHSS